MAAPQLRLEVSLNLAGFRSEIQKLTYIAQSEFAPKINVKFNKRTLDTELNNLQAAIKRRVYRVEIGGNIDSFPRAIENIRKQLAALETQNKIEIPISVKNGVTQKEARKVRSSVYRSVMAEGGKILLPVGLRPVSQTASDKFKTDLRQKLGSITVKIKADLESASISSGAKSRSDIEADVRRGLEAISEIGAQRMAGGTGGVTEPARREQLKQSLSQGGFDIATLKEIGKQLGVSGVGRFKIANNLIEKIVTESSIEMVKKYLDPQAVMRNPDRSGLGKVLDTFARGIFNMLGMDPASIRAQQQASRPKSFMPAGLLPPSAGPAGLLPPAYRGIGPSAKPAGLLPSLSSAGRSNAIIEALIASTGPRLLPSGGGDDSLGKLAAPRQTKDAVDAILRNYFKVLEVQVKEVFSAPPVKKESLNIFDHLDTEQYFNYLAQARINAENAIKQSIEEGKQVAKQNRVKDAAQSFLRALEENVRNAERSIFLQSRIAANRSYVQRANVREIGQPLLSGKQATTPKMLSAATGFYRGASTSPAAETQAQLFARREREARMRSALRGVDVMGETPTRGPARYSYANRPAMPRRPTSAIVPYETGGALVPSGGGGAGGAPPAPPRGGGGGTFGGMQFNMPQLPGAGLVREIGEEFGFAAKQVLLFGVAYKALAFIQSFPGQVGEAVGALQSFRNTIKEISPSAQEAADSSQFILDIVDKYNTPLQSARDGFVKLYASMQPAGFSGDEIRDLFLGISQTAATFGMSADKVDRVNYAFAQMASKGQVMSEELKGQLGDVLPGAMAIFAEAAGFKGPEAITKFSKALEDGAYKGAAMKVLLTNVGSIMRKEFGPGAEGAARTFQGVMNRMQNSLKLLYEAFEPVAVGFLNSVVMPMTSGLATITDGFKAFFAGQAAQTAGGSVLAKQLDLLRPTFEGIAANIKQILPLLQSFANTALSLGQVLLQVAGNPFVGYLARIYLSVLPLTMALRALNLQVLIPLIGSFLRAIPAFISFNAAMISGTSANKGLQLAMQLTGQTAGVTAGKIRLVGAALATLGTTAILAGIGLLIERFLMMKSAIDGVRQSTQQMLGSISGMANSGAVKELQNVSKNIQRQKDTFSELKEFVSGGRLGGGSKSLTPEIAAKFEEVGMGSFVSKNLFGKPIITDFIKATEIIDARLQGLNKESSNVAEKLPLAVKVAAGIAKQAKTAETLATIPPGTGDGTGTKPPKEKSLESYYSLQDQLAKNFTQAEIDRLQAIHDQRMALQNEFFNQQEARANSFQKESIRFQRELASIENERKSALLKASLEVMQAQGSIMGGAAPTGAAVSGKTGLFQGSTGLSSGPHFDVRRQDGAYISPEQARALFDPSVRGRLAMTSAYGPRRAPVPGASTFHKGVDLAGPANTPLNLAAGYAMTGAGEKGGLGYAASVRGPQGEMYDVGHLQRPRAGAIAPRPVPGSEKRDLVAAQQVQIANSQRITTGLNAEELAYEKTKTAIANYVASIFSPEEQSLQNSLLAKRGELIRAGMDDDVIEIEMKRYEIQQKINIGLVDAKKALDEKKIGQKQYNDLVAELNNLLPASNKLLSEQNALLKDNAYGKRIEDLKEQIRLLLIINTEERRLAELTKEFNGDKVKAQEIFDLEKIKENIEATRALIGDFVSSTSSDYKGFLKAVISGEDAADALKQFQEGLKDRVLTIFLDFAMAPVEKFFKEGLEGLFLPKAGSIPGLDAAKEATKDPVEATNSNTNATVENTQAIKDFTASMSGDGTGGSNQAAGFTAGMQDLGGMAFDGGNSSAIDTSLEGWNTALNTSISDSIKESTGKVKVEGATFKESLSKAVGAVGMAAGAIMGIAAGVSQVKQGGTSNVLGGIGSIMTSIGGVLGGFGGLFGGGGGGGGLSSGFNAGTSSAVGTGSAGWASSFATPLKFANGGMVTGPTLGLIGEGKYNEAIVPLPDGRSIPVQFNQQSSLREAMAGGSNNASAPSVLSMTFESTNINGVEYVSRDQLEQAMAQTRRQASRDGAQRGMTMTLDKLQQSPSTRSRLGMR